MDKVHISKFHIYADQEFADKTIGKRVSGVANIDFNFSTEREAELFHKCLEIALAGAEELETHDIILTTCLPVDPIEDGGEGLFWGFTASVDYTAMGTFNERMRHIKYEKSTNDTYNVYVVVNE